VNRVYAAIGALLALLLAVAALHGFADLVLWVGLIIFGALLTLFVMSVTNHPAIAMPDFPSEYAPADRAPDTEDVTQAEAEDAEAAA